MAWLLVAVAIAVEIVATVALKLSQGLTRFGPSVVVLVGYVATFALLAWALKLGLQVSVVYAVWSGTGTAAIAVIGMIWLHEPLTPVKAVGIGLIITGVVLLRLAGS